MPTLYPCHYVNFLETCPQRAGTYSVTLESVTLDQLPKTQNLFFKINLKQSDKLHIVGNAAAKLFVIC